MSVFISPGVYTTILDLSLYVPNLSTTLVGMVGLASKGPMNEATYVSDVLSFVTAFGQPNPNYFGPYAMLQFLRYGRQAYYVRVAGASAAAATADVNEAVVTASVTSGVAGPYVIQTADNNVLRVKLNGGTFRAITLTKGVRTATQVAADITAALVGFVETNYAVSVVGGAVKIATTTQGAGGSVQIDTVLNGSTANTVLGFAAGTVTGAAAAAASVKGTLNQSFNIVAASNDALTVIIDGVAFNVTLTAGGTQSSADIASDINAVILTAGTASAFVDGGNTVVKIVSATTGALSSVQVSPASTAATTLGFDFAIHIGSAATTASTTGAAASTFALGANQTLKVRFNAGSLRTVSLTPGTARTAAQIIAEINTVVGPAGYNEGVATVTSAGKINIASLTSGAAGSVQVDSSGTGQYFGNFSTSSVPGTGALATPTFAVTAATKGTHGNALTVTVSLATNGTDFQIKVYDGERLAERWDNLTKTSTSDNYLETVINDISTYITVADQTGNANNPGYGDNLLAGGNDGLSDVSDADYIGTVTSLGKTGLQIFLNAEDFDLNLLATPGVSSAAVINEMLLICATRGDAMALIDPPFGLSVQQVTDWHNGYGAYSDHSAFNTLYGALYWPWLQIYDAVNKQKVWVPPSGLVAGVYAFTDYTTETWFAPAGFNRGGLLQPLKLEYNADLGERDLMYGNQNAVNPIINDRRNGITVWGQRSLQRKPSALDRVNVVRLVLYLRKVIATAVKYLVFEPNDPVTWATFVNTVAPYMESVKQRRGVYEYKVICDKSTNPPDAIDRGEMHAVVALKPVKAAEFIEVKFAVTTTGANFDELTF